MQKLTTLILCTAAVMTASAYAQSASANPPSNQAQFVDSPLSAKTPGVAVIDMNDLPFGIQVQVSSMIAHADKGDLQALQNSIEATPEASAALKARGLNPTEVVAALVDDEGGLTLVTDDET